MSDNLKLRKLPPLGDLPKLGNPTKGFGDDGKPKTKSKSDGRNRNRSRSRSRK